LKLHKICLNSRISVNGWNTKHGFANLFKLLIRNFCTFLESEKRKKDLPKLTFFGKKGEKILSFRSTRLIMHINSIFGMILILPVIKEKYSNKRENTRMKNIIIKNILGASKKENVRALLALHKTMTSVEGMF